ncbi:hypothetical protein CC1G_12311 [Coprinopsis cinerea okayama7|uniref:Uncharacterized protein n=1 Tax=Coprinopsis cinerea (strain Okayama-7 / 130 / ATCC MYA-4618 / FGSC 9003) TaxID=240176 RepID=A8NLV5_COPC7|nr:hypothetical protein CC1G_12311 [Coprinopsis cinerea okayama7\|eukprot:XP_001834784.2 hypothetical protein CC1G_12311 [Coprinopsis cinerea okayama7\
MAISIDRRASATRRVQGDRGCQSAATTAILRAWTLHCRRELDNAKTVYDRVKALSRVDQNGPSDNVQPREGKADNDLQAPDSRSQRRFKEWALTLSNDYKYSSFIPHALHDSNTPSTTSTHQPHSRNMENNKYRLYIAFYTDFFPAKAKYIYEKYYVGLLLIPKGADIKSSAKVAQDICYHKGVFCEGMVKSRPDALVGLLFLDKVANPQQVTAVLRRRLAGSSGGRNDHGWVVTAIEALVEEKVIASSGIKAADILKTGFVFTDKNSDAFSPMFVPTCCVNGKQIKSALEGF